MNTQLFIVPQLLEGVGPINAATKKMAEQMGMDDPREVFRCINSGEWVVSAVKPIEMPVWKTVKLGTCKTPDEYRKALKKVGRRIGDLGDDILGRITCSKEEVDLDLVVLSVSDLGLKNSARYADICAKAQKLGLELCPAEVGPALRLQYGDQPKDEWLHVLTTDRSGLDEFTVENDGGELWLSGYDGPFEGVLDFESFFVFGRRK